MEFGAVFNSLLLINLFLLIGFFFYLSTKATAHATVLLLLLAIVPLTIFQLGAYLFAHSPTASYSSMLAILGASLTPLSLTPFSQNLGRNQNQPRMSKVWITYYIIQVLALGILVKELLSGQLIEWVTGILDQPIILIEKHRRFWFLNVLISCGVILLCLENTLRSATKAQLDRLKFILVAFVGFVVYFSYLSAQILLASYLSQSMLSSGAAIIFLGIVLLCYSFAKYPFWEIKIGVSRQAMFSSLSLTAVVLYIIISGNIVDFIRWTHPDNVDVILPAIVFALGAVFLLIYLSPRLQARMASFLTRNFFRNKYDYRDLWMKFTEQSSGTVSLTDLLPRVGEFIADAMFLKQVTIWLKTPNSDSFGLAYSHDPDIPMTSQSATLQRRQDWSEAEKGQVFTIPDEQGAQDVDCPFEDITALRATASTRFVLIQKGKETIAVLGIGSDIANRAPSREDDRLLMSLCSQLEQLILNQKLSEELLLAREWESFNRFASFVIHDLKNLATMQGMTLENAKSLKSNPDFVADAFATFAETTDKMVNLIASLSVRRGQFSFKQQPVNILDILSTTFDNLNLNQRNGVKFVTAFPPKEHPPMVSGDPELLQKAFTNIILNAIQSLPGGEGSVEIQVTNPYEGIITAAIRDTGCGIPPERLQNLFRPFQTTKKNGTGIGLSHTRSIIEVHGGRMRIESQINAGTKVELDLPTL